MSWMLEGRKYTRGKKDMIDIFRNQLHGPVTSADDGAANFAVLLDLGENVKCGSAWSVDVEVGCG